MRTKFPFENAILDIAYGTIDAIKLLPGLTNDEIGGALASATRSLAPAIAFAYALGYESGVQFHRLRHRLEDALVLGDLK